ncbi:MAG: hypothetical protein IJT94_11990, partial [Oscillibacter sp.]|nr:hypothetical protein [Oscillibacter sp.]
ADQPDIHGSSFAGGLVGQSAGDLNIINSYAALVVSSASQTDGSGTTGGLIGASDGNLTVNSSYADCYLSGGTIGGIAGSLGKDTETTFEKTYSAGFAVYPLLDGQKPEDVTSAGGQFFGSRADGASVTFAVPEDGDNREKCCSLFNFTDVTASPDESGGRPKLSDVTEQRDGDGITGGENLLITEEELASIRQDPGGMTEKEKADAAEHPYNLSGADLGMGDTFPYPGFGLPRHGDWMPDADMGLVPVSGTVSKAVRILYLLFDEKGNALVKDAPAFDTDGTLDGRRFKGTARMNVTLPPQKATAMEMEAYRAAYGTVMLGVPENITGCAFAGWYTFDAALDDDTPMVDLTQLLSADEVLKDGTLTYQFEEAYVQSVRDGTAAAPTLYAVYKDARPLTVTLEFYYLDKTMAAKDQAVKAQKGEALSFRDLYMGGCGVKILQSVKYEIPHGEIGKERTVTLPEIEGYMFLDSSTGELGANYRGPCARLSGADGVSAEDALKRNDSENAWTLTISTDQPYTYALLYEYAVKTFDIQYAFHQSRPDEAVIGGELNRAAVEAAMNGGPAYTAEESSTFRVVKQGLEESADSSTTMYQYAFPGFELYKTENQNLGTSHQTIFHYRRNAYALSYDLRGGYDTESGSRTSYRATRSVYYGEPLDGYLPGESVKKNGYALECWSLDWRGKTG